MIIKLYRD